MLTRMCDKCGKYYEHYDGSKTFKGKENSNAILFIDRDLKNEYWSRKTYDLCVECMTKILNFIKNEEDE